MCTNLNNNLLTRASHTFSGGPLPRPEVIRVENELKVNRGGEKDMADHPFER